MTANPYIATDCMQIAELQLSIAFMLCSFKIDSSGSQHVKNVTGLIGSFTRCFCLEQYLREGEHHFIPRHIKVGPETYPIKIKKTTRKTFFCNSQQCHFGGGGSGGFFLLCKDLGECLTFIPCLRFFFNLFFSSGD